MKKRKAKKRRSQEWNLYFSRHECSRESHRTHGNVRWSQSLLHQRGNNIVSSSLLFNPVWVKTINAVLSSLPAICHCCHLFYNVSPYPVCTWAISLSFYLWIPIYSRSCDVVKWFGHRIVCTMFKLCLL